MTGKLPRTLLGCAFAVTLGLPHAARAAEAKCPFPGQVHMLQVQLFFGLDADGGVITAKDWEDFLKNTVTPRFPSGFTVYDGYGQWLDSQTHALSQEKSKTLQVVEPDSPEVRAKVEELSRIYRERFHQKAVGILTNDSCAAF